jgi:hypothetical protein
MAQRSRSRGDRPAKPYADFRAAFTNVLAVLAPKAPIYCERYVNRIFCSGAEPRRCRA